MSSALLSRRNFVYATIASGLSLSGLAAQGDEANVREYDGLCWSGDMEKRKQFTHALIVWLNTQGISSNVGTLTHYANHSQWLLKTELAPSQSTLDLRHRAELWVDYDRINKIFPNGTVKTATVSLKEIFFALTHPGRSTFLEPHQSSFTTLLNHMAQRQAIVLWAQELGWRWPEGTPAKWNMLLWKDGTPIHKSYTYAAFKDAVVHPERYKIGCYTGAKMVVAMGLLDHAYRLNPNNTLKQGLIQALWSNNDPLVDMEPTETWSFDPDLMTYPAHPGKTHILLNAAPRHMVPGDWIYIYNDDKVSAADAGYEGSNAIYLGGGLFSDYYNTSGGYAFTFEQKLEGVYQWRHKVYNRTRHYANAKELTLAERALLEKSPNEGGLLLPWRLVPRMDLAVG